MPSKLRKRKGSTDSSQLPRSASNPKPQSNESGHVALSRQGPTIVPTVFIFLIVGLLLVLPPIFYYTQVMIPDLQSTSILSQFRRKGNILINALGHASSTGQGRIAFSLRNPIDQPSEKVVDTEKGHKLSNRDQESHLMMIQKESTTVGQKQGQQDSDLEEPFKILNPSISIVPSDEPLENQEVLDEELGKFWAASSQYRKQAQKVKSGEYLLQGDGTTEKGPNKEKSSHSKDESLNGLPEADPDAKEGLTREFWDAIKSGLSADDLTVFLNELRTKEQQATTQSKL